MTEVLITSIWPVFCLVLGFICGRFCQAPHNPEITKIAKKIQKRRKKRANVNNSYITNEEYEKTRSPESKAAKRVLDKLLPRKDDKSRD
jgi:hypothetical protein